MDKTQLLASDSEVWSPATIKGVLEDGAAVVETEDGEGQIVAAAELVERAFAVVDRWQPTVVTIRRQQRRHLHHDASLAGVPW